MNNIYTLQLIVHPDREIRKYYLQGVTTYVIICGNENYVEWLRRLYELQNCSGQLLRAAGTV